MGLTKDPKTKLKRKPKARRKLRKVLAAATERTSQANCRRLPTYAIRKLTKEAKPTRFRFRD